MTEFERGMVLSSMADDSVARTLGRSLAWVKRARAAAKVEVAAPVETVQARAAAKAGEVDPARRPVPPPKVVEDVAPEAVADPVETAPPVPAPVAVPPPPMPAAVPPPPMPVAPEPVVAKAADLTPSGHPVRRAATAAAPRPLRIPPRVLGWCRQFLAAGWTPREVAWLFDLNGRDMMVAIRGAAR